MKKITHTLVLALGFFLFLGTNIHAQTINFGNSEVCPGDAVTIPVTLTNNEGFVYLIVKANLSGSWTPANLTHTTGDTTGVSFSDFSYNPMTQDIVFYINAEECIEGDFVLFNLVFNVPYGAEGCIEITLEQEDRYNQAYSCDWQEISTIESTSSSICIADDCVLEDCCNPDSGNIVIDADPSTFTIVCMEGYENCEDVTYGIGYFDLTGGNGWAYTYENCIAIPCDAYYVIVIVAENEECGLEDLEVVVVQGECEKGLIGEDDILSFIQKNGFDNTNEAFERSSIDNDEDSFNISPNPFSQDFQIKLSANKQEAYQLTIFDVQGKVISNSTGAVNKGNNTISVKELRGATDGFYFYQLNTESNNYSGKILKTNS